MSVILPTLGRMILPSAVGATTGALSAGDHPIQGAMLGASLGSIGGLAGRVAGTGVGAIHGGVKGSISGAKAGVDTVRKGLDNFSHANLDVTAPHNPVSKIIGHPLKAVGGAVGAGVGGVHGAVVGGTRGGDLGALGGSAIGGTLGGTIAGRPRDKDKHASKEQTMGTPFTEYLRTKTAGYSYYSPALVPTAIGALTGGLTAGPGRHMLGAGLGAGAGLVGGHVGGLAGGTLGAIEQGQLNKKMEELALKEHLSALGNTTGYGGMIGQAAGAGAGGYVGGRLANIGNSQDNAG